MASSEKILCIVNDHPLEYGCTADAAIDHQQESNQTSTNTSWHGLDPLSVAISNDNRPDCQLTSSNPDTFLDSDLTTWQCFKRRIVNKFTATEKLSIKSSFQFDKTINQINTTSMNNVSQKVKHRLEQLDELEEGFIQEVLCLSQQEYTKRMDEMNEALKEAWKTDQRVKALKIAIQCAKQLSSINVIQFYPSKFVIITDILDHFGGLVFDRIEKKATCLMNYDNANETCRNWFFKISSIRELLPRFYVECCILKIYNFLIKTDHNEQFEKIFHRLTKMIRGIADPIVASYCRVYLSRTIMKVNSGMKKVLLQNIYDIIDNANQLICPVVQQCLASQKVDYNQYYTLFVPALDWLFNCLLLNSYHCFNDSLLKYYRNKIQLSNYSSSSAFILSSLITCLPSEFLARNLFEILSILNSLYKNSDGTSKTCYPKYILLKNMAHSLLMIEHDFMNKYCLDKQHVLEEFQNSTQTLQHSSEQYLICLQTWSEIIAKYYNVQEINQFVGNIIGTIKNHNPNNSDQINNNDNIERCQMLLQILKNITKHGIRFGNELFAMNNLLPLIDLISRSEVRIEGCKTIIEAFNNQSTTDWNNNDPVITNCMIYVCKMIHDSTDALTMDDEKRQISNLIISFIDRMSTKQDLESRLNFYIESRENYHNLDAVLSCLVQHVNCLAIECHMMVEGHHTKKTISFVNACIAFSFITIPSIDDIVTRLQLNLSTCHVSLINACLPQTDSFLKLTITTLRQFIQHDSNWDDCHYYSKEQFIHSFTAQLLSTLIAVPDNPELGILYLFKGLYNVVKEFEFETHSNYKILIWINMIKYLTICNMDNYPYHVAGVDSNDTLYARDDEFVKEIEIYYDIIFGEMFDLFQKCQHCFNLKQQCNLALEFIDLIIKFGNVPKMSHFINQLWNWSRKIQYKNNFAALQHKFQQTHTILAGLKLFNSNSK